MALRSHGAVWAINGGYASIRTHNAQSDTPMLAIDDRLRFERSHATIVYLNSLSVVGA